MSKDKKKPYLGGMVISSFLAFICAVQIDSASADAHNFNGRWVAATVCFALVFGFFLYKAIKTPMR